MKYASIRGMEDILAPDIRLWQRIEGIARRELEACGYSEIRTPVLEETAVFARGIGETTDIVSKEMYTFADRKGRSMSLRPEGTAPIVRAFIEHGMHAASQVHRLYYIGPMFRSERPQKGRSRQFHQIGLEVFGSDSPFADAEVISQLHGMLAGFGLSGFAIKLNSLGCTADKEAFAGSMRRYLADKTAELCEDCRARVDKNVLRVLDCKNDSCAAVVRRAPKALDTLCGSCADHFKRVKAALTALGIGFTESANLVRGLDYYTGTVFEVTHPDLGSQDAIAAGGRYDGLVKDMGGPDVPAVGYALGMERVTIALKGKVDDAARPDVIYIATLDDAAKIEGMKLAERIRQALPRAVVLKDITGSSLKSQMRSADKSLARVVLMLGEEEVKNGKITVKSMDGKSPQDVIASGDIIEELKRRLC
jgi:histidyl-tRNA synthetase